MRAHALYLGPDLTYSVLNRHPFGYDALSTAAILVVSSSAGPLFALVSMTGFYRRQPNVIRRRSSKDRNKSSSGTSTVIASSRISTAPSGFSGPTSPPHSEKPTTPDPSTPISSHFKLGCSFLSRHSRNSVVVQKPGRAPSAVAFSQNSSFDDDRFLISASPRILSVNVSFIFFSILPLGIIKNVNLEKESVSTPKDETYVEYEALRKEIDDMLSVLPGEWLVEELRLDDGSGDMWYSAIIAADRIVLLVSGKGRTKAEALEKILENWRTGTCEPYAPAAGSAEELRLKLAVQKG